MSPAEISAALMKGGPELDGALVAILREGVRAPVIERTLSAMLGSNSKHIGLILQCVAATGMRDPLTVERLAPWLDKDDPAVLQGACDVVVAIGEAAGPLLPELEPLLEHEERWVRLHALSAISALGVAGLSARPAVVRAIEKAPDADIRNYAGDILRAWRAWPVVTLQGAREVLQRSSAEFGVNPLLLMENAGRALANAAETCVPHSPATGHADQVLAIRARRRERGAVVVCGSGPHAGVGFATARHLQTRDWSVCVLLTGDEASVMEQGGEAAIQHDIASRQGIVFMPRTEKIRARVVIDCLLDPAAGGELDVADQALVETMNGGSYEIISADVPSGLNGNTGDPQDTAVRASMTVALGMVKPGILSAQARPFVGRLQFANLGLPPALFDPPEA